MNPEVQHMLLGQVRRTSFALHSENTYAAANEMK